MQVVTITPPPAVVSREEAKRHLRVESGDDDDFIGDCLAAAQGQIDGPAGWLGRAIGVQTLELQAPVLDHDCWAWIRLPCPPVTAVVSVTYGAAGVVVDPDGYVFGPGELVRPVTGLGWPWPWDDRPTVKVRYTAGYPVVPPPIKAALLLMTADLYGYRGAKVDRNLVDNPTVERLLAPFRVWP